MISLVTDRGPLSEYQLATLIRFWLATPEGRAADPMPLAGAETVWSAPPLAAYTLQQAINGLPLAAIYALLAAAYSLVYGLVGRINLAFGELAAAGGYAAAFGVLLAAGFAPAALLGLALALAVSTAGAYGVASGRMVFAPLHRASGQQALVATVGLSLFLQEFLRLTIGSQFDEETLAPSIARRLIEIGGAVDFAALRGEMDRTAAAVRRRYREIVESEEEVKT